MKKDFEKSIKVVSDLFDAAANIDKDLKNKDLFVFKKKISLFIFSSI